MRLALIQMYHGLEWSVPTSSSQGNTFENPKHKRDRPSGCTALIFTIAGGQLFVTPMIIHKAENYTQDLHWDPPSEWLLHNTTLGYIDKDGWMKA